MPYQPEGGWEARGPLPFAYYGELVFDLELVVNVKPAGGGDARDGETSYWQLPYRTGRCGWALRAETGAARLVKRRTTVEGL